MQDENVELLNRVMQQRKDIQGLMKGLETAVADLEGSVATLNSETSGVDGLREQTREVDEDMRMTS